MVEQVLAVLVGMADVVMVAAVGEAAVSGVSLVEMCIRDSSTAELVPAALSSGCSSEGTIVNTPCVLVTSIEATSASSRFKSAMSCDAEAVVAVSYTHLDVYKRQRKARLGTGPW